ncbi:MAG TPA: hypothetical protein ENI62_04995 [Gammaproteobacteria bacterium]|nr:hypothetical protein [Gammaproteobacteria bacterium]
MSFYALPPVFDVTYSFNSVGNWTASYQMAINGKSGHFPLDDFKDCAALMKRGRAIKTTDEVKQMVSNSKQYADDADVDPLQCDQIYRTLRLTDFQKKVSWLTVEIANL